MAGKRDLKLDKGTHDLVIENSDLQIVSDIEWLEQSIKIKLQFFLAEWFLDTTAGLDYANIVFVKDPDLNLVDNLYKIALTEYDEVVEILEFNSSFDVAQRQLNVSFTIDTIFGEITQSITI